MPATLRYPRAIWHPWRYRNAAGEVTYYANQNEPEANVLHISQGYIGTALSWSAAGYYGASWTYSIEPERGQVYQHLEHHDGGYQAGISKYRRRADGSIYALNPYPTWPLFKGWQEDGAPNVNCYTIGTEHMGFAENGGFTEPQLESSLLLNEWLCSEYGWEKTPARFPAHADIALIDRPNDFGYPYVREAYYQLLTGGAGMPAFTDNHQEMLYGLVDLLIGSPDGIEYVNDIDRLIALRAAVANDLRFSVGLGNTQAKVAELANTVAQMAVGSIGQSTGARAAEELAAYFAKLGQGFADLGKLSTETGTRLANSADAEEVIDRR